MRTYRFHLPQYPESLIPAFRGLCRVYEGNDFQRLKERLSELADQFQKYSMDFLGPDLQIAQSLFETSRRLLESYESYPSEKQALIIGAVRYFIMHRDSLPDAHPIAGLDDDLAVFNYVTERLE